jgi:dehydrogenase/reductase SDR family member 7B
MAAMSARFADQVVWITGASSGIGAALARAFNREGALLILSARRAERLEALREGLDRPDDVLVLPLDVADPSAIDAAAQQALAWRGRIDLLINNAGISQRSLVEETTMHTHRQVMEVNFFGAVQLTSRLLPSMLAAGHGHIVNISSLAGYVSTPLRSAYSASKHALRAYSDSLRAEVSGRGLDVTVICPGYIRTEISKAALTGDGTPKGEHDQVILSGLDPDLAARRMLDGIHRRRRELTVGGRETWVIVMQRFFPGLVARLLPRAVPE